MRFVDFIFLVTSWVVIQAWKIVFVQFVKATLLRRMNDGDALRLRWKWPSFINKVKQQKQTFEDDVLQTEGLKMQWKSGN